MAKRAAAAASKDGLVTPDQIEYWPLDKFVLYEKNPRRHTQDVIKRMANSLREFGFPIPVLAKKSTGEVCDGHLRLKGASAAGLPEAPFINCDGWTPQKMKAFRLMANRSVNWAQWDEDLLGLELEDLKGLDFDLGLTGFDDLELSTLFPEAAQPRRLHQIEIVNIADLKDHPRNYRSHPDDQLEHIIQSIKEHGFYRSVVVAKENTILAGHGLVKACRKMGRMRIQVTRFQIEPDSIEALKLLAGDNDIQNRGEVNDRALTELLKEIRETDSLLGSGYDDMMLANLLYVTRPASEIRGINQAAEWVGMPDYDGGEKPLQLLISFRSEEDRTQFVETTGIDVVKKHSKLATWCTWWPAHERQDLSSLKFEQPTATV